ncbi:hypothetical protein OG979_22300 [Actinomadura citrea]|uniref:hypothetical protein n=1 Tax=Actinomadura citrea TaxID=46158 RepID=UPI002E2DB574|nr:hypothetical protein [Actinomadura citrea]
MRLWSRRRQPQTVIVANTGDAVATGPGSYANSGVDDGHGSTDRANADGGSTPVADTEDAIATGDGGHANTGVIFGSRRGRNRTVIVADTGDAIATGPGSYANSGIDYS